MIKQLWVNTAEAKREIDRIDSFNDSKTIIYFIFTQILVQKALL